MVNYNPHIAPGLQKTGIEPNIEGFLEASNHCLPRADKLKKFQKEFNLDRNCNSIVTVHYNNSIVCHPDTRNCYAIRLNNNLSQGKCRFGIRCISCKWFISYENMINRERGEIKAIKAKNCQLWNDRIYKSGCPGIQKQKACGTKDKTFGIDFQTYNQIADRTAFMYHNRKHKLIFAALTIPPTKSKINGNLLNEAFSKFIENLRSHYDLLHYIAIREGDGLNTRYHYHIILDIRFVNFTRLNSAWCSALRDICVFSNNAFRTKSKSFYIKDIAGAISYVTKYISKEIGTRSNSRVFFCDRETANAIVKIRLDNDLQDIKDNFKSIRRKILNDYVCRFTFANKRDQNMFFHTVVKVLFRSVWSVPGMTVFSGEPPG